MVWAGEGLSLSSKQSKLGRIKKNGPNQTPSDKVHGSLKKKKKKKKNWTMLTKKKFGQWHYLFDNILENKL